VRLKIISGGQTGADRAALDAAIDSGVEHGGYLPRGRLTEAGPLPARYRLRELPSARYRDRTEQNVKAAEATLILSFGVLTGGSALTEALAIRHDRPCLHIDFEVLEREQAVDLVVRWLREHDVRVLNVAGPRASSEPGIYQAVYDLLVKVIARIEHDTM